MPGFETLSTGSWGENVAQAPGCGGAITPEPQGLGPHLESGKEYAWRKFVQPKNKRLEIVNALFALHVRDVQSSIDTYPPQRLGLVAAYLRKADAPYHAS